MSEVKVNKISPRTNCGTVTLGDSGDTIALGSGATQTGFGRTGTVDWETTPKTGDFTAANGEGYFINTAGGAVTVTLPGSPSAGNIVSVSDYNGTAATNAITVARNGSNINGDASDLEITKADAAVTLVYVDATVGWTSVQTSNTQDIINTFVSATGGTETTSGDFKIHTFTGPGTFTVTNAGTPSGSNTVSYMVVAGGGSGGAGAKSSSHGGGGGGGGGFREGKASTDCYSASPANAPEGLPVSAQAYPITVGAGGTGPVSAPAPTQPGSGGKGANSVFSTITSTGGGGGGNRASGDCTQSGAPGGSGGGAGGHGSNAVTLGAGNTPPVNPPQGNPGGFFPGVGTNFRAGAGGGGATAVGTPASPAPGASGCQAGVAGVGGAGATSSINGTPTARAGGGGGGSTSTSGGVSSQTGGAGGSGGGGAGMPYNACASATAGTTNTGGGGGGGTGPFTPGTPSVGAGANGGSGIVIIRYKFQ